MQSVTFDGTGKSDANKLGAGTIFNGEGKNVGKSFIEDETPKGNEVVGESVDDFKKAEWLDKIRTKLEQAGVPEPAGLGKMNKDDLFAFYNDEGNFEKSEDETPEGNEGDEGKEDDPEVAKRKELMKEILELDEEVKLEELEDIETEELELMLEDLKTPQE